ncbi:MAG: hypothetical protein A2020_12210 [Lentisphaerae bacterium GWF2_45_14]|nr:MAG: hypothetical protein A2020_12210 [Lentisphaerae bacterium GWF2_45_14]
MSLRHVPVDISDFNPDEFLKSTASNSSQSAMTGTIDISDFDPDSFLGTKKEVSQEEIRAAFPEPSRVRSPEERDYREFLTLHGVNPATGGYNVETKLPETMANKAVKSFESGTLQAGASLAAVPGFVGGIDRALRASALEKRKAFGDPIVDIIPQEYRDSLEKRTDGSFKGKGFYGELKRPDGGVSTELSFGTSDVEPGKEVEIPALVPGLSQEQKDYLLSTKPEESSKKNPQMWDSIVGQAVNFAKERKAKGLPYFASNTEQPIDKQDWIDVLDGTAKFMKDKAAKRMQTVSGGLDIIDTFKQKGTAAGVEQILYGVVNQVPNLATQIAALSLTGGTGSLAYMGVTSAADKRIDIKDNPNMSEWGKIANELGTGGFEIFGERIGGLPILKRIMGDAPKKAIKKGVTNFLKTIGFDMFQEGGSEVVTQIGQNLTDMLTGNTDKPLSEMTIREKAQKLGQGAVDAGIIGGVMGGGMGTVEYAGKPKISTDERTDLLNDSKTSTSSNELENVPESQAINFPASGGIDFDSMGKDELSAYITDKTGQAPSSLARIEDLAEDAKAIQNAEAIENASNAQAASEAQMIEPQQEIQQEQISEEELPVPESAAPEVNSAMQAGVKPEILPADNAMAQPLLGIAEGPGDIPVTSLNIEEALRIMKESEVDYTLDAPQRLPSQNIETTAKLDLLVPAQEKGNVAFTPTPELIPNIAEEQKQSDDNKLPEADNRPVNIESVKTPSGWTKNLLKAQVYARRLGLPVRLNDKTLGLDQLVKNIKEVLKEQKRSTSPKAETFDQWQAQYEKELREKFNNEEDVKKNLDAVEWARHRWGLKGIASRANLLKKTVLANGKKTKNKAPELMTPEERYHSEWESPDFPGKANKATKPNYEKIKLETGLDFDVVGYQLIPKQPNRFQKRQIFTSSDVQNIRAALREQGHNSIVNDYYISDADSKIKVGDGQIIKLDGGLGKDYSLPTAPIHFREIKDAIAKHNPVSALAIESFEIKLPEDYVRDGNKYVFNKNQLQSIPTTRTESKKLGFNKNTPVQKIEDFGEKIGGAKKDLWKSKFADAFNKDTRQVPLSESFPEPDYNALLESGLSKKAVAFIHTIRDTIPSKPRRWGLDKYAKGVEESRETARLIIEGKINDDSITETLHKLHKNSQGLYALYEAMGHDRSLKDYSIGMHYYELYNGIKQNVNKWAISDTNTHRDIIHADTAEDAIEKFKKYLDGLSESGKNKKIEFVIYSKSNEKGKYYISKKTGSNYIDLKSFDNVEDAKKYRIDNYSDLVNLLEKSKYIPETRTDTNRERVGKDYRQGKDVTPEMFTSAFGFRGIEFGNWVAKTEERQASLNRAFDALHDLADILGVATQALSLNGQLGLAFGARGAGGRNSAAAHYELDKVVINLTRKNGAGSLAHEWWHALDNYFPRMRDKPAGHLTTMPFALRNKDGSVNDSVRSEMINAFDDVMKAIYRSEMKTRSKRLDSTRTKEYWAKDVEMSARAFESYILNKIEGKEFSNDYLVNIVNEEAFQKDAEEHGGNSSYPYPLKAEQQEIDAVFDKFFDTIEEKEENGKHVLYRSSEYGNIRGGDKIRARRIIREMTGSIDNVRFAEKLFSNDGQEVLGKYEDAYIDIAENKGNIEDTARHEALHYAYDLLLTEREAQIFNEAASAQELNHEQAIEGINKFAHDHSGLRGKARLIAGRIIRRIRQLFGAERMIDRINEIYDRALSRKYAERELTGKSNYGGEVQYMSQNERKNLTGLIEQFKKELDNVEMNKEQKGIYDVITGNKRITQIRKNDLDNLAGFVNLEKGSGEFGATHIMAKHFDGTSGKVTAREIINIGEVIRHGKIRGNGDRHIYTLWENNQRYRAIVLTDGKKQSVITFYSNKTAYSPGDHTVPDGTKTNDEYAFSNSGGSHNAPLAQKAVTQAPKTIIHENNENVKELNQNEKNEPDDNFYSNRKAETRGNMASPRVESDSKDFPHTRISESDNLRSDSTQEQKTVAEEIPDSINDKTDKSKYRTLEVAEMTHESEMKQNAQHISFAREWLNTLFEKDTNAKTDVRFLSPLLQTIFYYSKKVPALGRVFDSAMRLRDNKYFYENMIFNADSGMGESELEPIVKFSKANKAEWTRLSKDYLWKRDIDAVGYKVRQSDDGTVFRIYTPENILIDQFSNENAAWEAAWRAEVQDMKKAGWSNGACETVLKLRRIMGRQYEILKNGVEQQKKALKELGAEMPEISGIDIFEELKKMGDRRGYYMPRMRHGNHMLWAHKTGENPRLEIFDTKLMRAKRASELRRNGYTAEMSQSNTPSEDVFAGSDITAMNDLINNAMDRIRKSDELTFERFGLTGEWIDYPLKNSKTERHFVISGGNTSIHHNLFKEFGGNYYGDMWHFKDRKKSFEKTILKAIAHVEGAAIVQTDAIGRALAEQIAAIIHSHGSRSHKIKRDDRTGKDVYLGFEEDIIQAATLTGRAIAGGSAKRIMAKEMLEAFTGHDLKWKDYKAEHMPKDVKLGSPEYYQAMEDTWNGYQDTVRARGIESSKQKIAYREGKSFMNDMLRNEEPMERVFGIIKGIAAFKFLSGVSSGVINLTALATSVPAAMKSFGNIGFVRSGFLLIAASNRYTRYMMRKKFGIGKTMSDNEEWLFGEITRRGWDADLQNQELTGATMTWGDKTWRSIVDLSMIVFSTTERLNRASTIAAAYNGMAEKFDGELPERQRDNLLLKAKEISDKAHGVYGKENLPSWARGASAGAHVARSFYMYKTFTHNYLQLMGEMFKGKKVSSFAWMTIAPAIVGGYSANALEPILKALASLIPGLPDDPEEALYKWLQKTFGKTAERFGRSGLAGLLGLNLKGSMAIGSFELPTTIDEVLGAPYAMGTSVFNGGKNILRGDWIKGAEELSPRFATGPIKAYREYTEGVTSKSNQPLYWGNERLKADYYDALLRFAGFNPAEISEKREAQWSEKQVEAKYGEERKIIYVKVRRFLLDGGATAEWTDILREIMEYNARVRSRELHNVPLITSSSLRILQRKMNTPEKREQLRGAEPEEDRKREDLSTFSFEDEPDSENAGRSRSRRANRRQTRR